MALTLSSQAVGYYGLLISRGCEITKSGMAYRKSQAMRSLYRTDLECNSAKSRGDPTLSHGTPLRHRCRSMPADFEAAAVINSFTE